ncbi:hypothetical protein [Bacillus glycinifermentans]|uniref:hypothetical protein n=1 Tax=Bacillus glycinifermentans TaxID=1664069 RepID=UPI003D1FB005
MQKIAAVMLFMAFAIIAGCQDQNKDEGKDRRLAAAEDMLEAIMEDDLPKMKQLYVEGATPSPEEVLKAKRNWGISGLDKNDFQMYEASIHTCFTLLTRRKAESPEKSRFASAMIQTRVS